MSRKLASALPAHRVEIRLAGSGGQGIILAGLVLAEAAGVYEGRKAAMVQSYGPEARGGASKAEIIISDSHIDYPLCTRVDVLLAMTQEASDAYSWDLKPGARVLVDRDLVSHPPTSRAIALPFTATARSRLNSTVAANVVALGAIVEVTGLISRRCLDRALQARLPADARTLNKKAVSLGIKLAREYLRKEVAEEAVEPRTEDM